MYTNTRAQQFTQQSAQQTSQTFSPCAGCRCTNCTQVKSDCQEIKKMLKEMHTKRIHYVSNNETSVKSVNLCNQELPEEVELSINYTYKDSGRQLMILDCGAPVSLAGISWMEQYLQEFGLTIDQMASTPCNQPFVFGPSRRYVSTSKIDLPVLVTRRDGKEDVLNVLTYLVDAEVPFLCGKKTLEDWNFQINS